MIDVYELEDFFTKRIIQLRMAKDVSARDMSLSMGQSHSYMHNLESNKSMPTMRNFFYICEYLNISPKEFFDFGPNAPERLKEIISDLKWLTPEQLAHIAAIVKELKR